MFLNIINLLITKNINTMILKISNPREAIIQSYTRPIAYKDYILLDGVVIIKFCKLGIWKEKVVRNNYGKKAYNYSENKFFIFFHTSNLQNLIITTPSNKM